jgi:hypothetical protein
LGQFVLLPKLETDESYNSNIFATRYNDKADLVSVIRPEVSLNSNFDRHAFNIHFLAEQYVYKTWSSENRLDLTGDVGGHYDLSGSTVLDASAQLYSRHEDRTSPDDNYGLRPTPTQGFVGRVAAKHEDGPVTVLTEISPQRLLFDGVPTATGSIIPSNDRDRWEIDGLVRASYEIFPGYAAVTQVSANTRDYDQLRDRNGYERSSTGYRTEAGLGVDLSQLLRGDFLVGYLQQDYQDPRLSDPHGLSVRATLNWTPDKLTIVVPALERSVDETTTPGASSLVRNTASVLVRHEVARNILLSGYGAVSYDDLSGLHQSDWVYESRVRATYAFSPQLYLSAEAAYQNKDAVVDLTGYQQTIFTLHLGAQL